MSARDQTFVAYELIGGRRYYLAHFEIVSGASAEYRYRVSDDVAQALRFTQAEDAAHVSSLLLAQWPFKSWSWTWTWMAEKEQAVTA